MAVAGCLQLLDDIVSDLTQWSGFLLPDVHLEALAIESVFCWALIADRLLERLGALAVVVDAVVKPESEIGELEHVFDL